MNILEFMRQNGTEMLSRTLEHLFLASISTLIAFQHFRPTFVIGGREFLITDFISKPTWTQFLAGFSQERRARGTICVGSENGNHSQP